MTDEPTIQITTSTPPPEDFVLPEGSTLVLRTCDKAMQGHDGFQWPMRGPVSCPDRKPNDGGKRHWDPTPECGNCLHGFLRGVGAGLLASWAPTAMWLVVEVVEADVVDLGDKVKFPRGIVRYAGERSIALALMARHAQLAPGHLCEQVACSGDGRTASATGDMGTASATGDRGTASATGDMGTASATGDRGTASATGYMGTASATGDGGTASATGDRGTASATGKHALVLTSGVAEVGELGTIIIKYWDAKAERWRVKVGYVGEDGIEAGRRYQLSDDGAFVVVDPQV